MQLYAVSGMSSMAIVVEEWIGGLSQKLCWSLEPGLWHTDYVITSQWLNEGWLLEQLLDSGTRSITTDRIYARSTAMRYNNNK